MCMRIKVFLSLLAFILSSCSFASDNPLIGSWKMDSEKTLKELKLPVGGSAELKNSAAKAKASIECFTNKLCGDVGLIYSEKEYITVIFDGKANKLSNASAPYKVIKIDGNHMIIDQLQNGGITNIFFEKDSFNVQVNVGEYTYRNYFKKLNNEQVDLRLQSPTLKYKLEINIFLFYN